MSRKNVSNLDPRRHHSTMHEVISFSPTQSRQSTVFYNSGQSSLDSYSGPDVLGDDEFFASPTADAFPQEGPKESWDRPKRMALLVGIAYHGKRWTCNGPTMEMPGAYVDVDLWKQQLIKRFDYEEENIRILVDREGEEDSWPTRQRIIYEMERLMAGLRAGDRRFFFFAGHGKQLSGYAISELDGRNEAFLPMDYETNLVQDNILRNILVNGMVAGASFTAVMDTCHSATMFDLPWRIIVNPDGTLKHEIAHYRAPDEIEGSVLCLSACQDDQEAYQIKTAPQTTHGALTSCMTWLLDNRDGDALGKYPSIQEVLQRVGGMLKSRQDVTVSYFGVAFASCIDEREGYV